MVEPVPAEPIPAATTALDQSLIAAGYEMAHAQLADPPDPARIAAARDALHAARAARWPDA